MGFDDRKANSLQIRNDESSQSVAVPENVIFARIARFIDKDALSCAQDALGECNIPKAKNKMDLAIKLIKLAKKKGVEDSIPVIVKIHPDRKIFESYYLTLIDKRAEEIASIKIAEIKTNAENEIKCAIDEAKKKEHENVEAIVKSLKEMQDAHAKHVSEREQREKEKDRERELIDRFSNAAGKSGCGCSGDDGYSNASGKIADYSGPLIIGCTFITVAAIVVLGYAHLGHKRD